ncbi:hypothetical protein ABH926_005875 [Catenulispora sp. GP43]|uniref:hypothetical protein n=1 Tax=Catenulispora sp. GP43 TaxID=3156263 RepID=UPI0035198051
MILASALSVTVLSAAACTATSSSAGSGGGGDSSAGNTADYYQQPKDAIVQDFNVAKVSVGGLDVNASVVQGLGCPNLSALGWVYPSSITPGLTSSDRPGAGPTHAGKTWDQAPAAFGVVAPSPVAMDLVLTSTSDNAITLAAPDVHVLSTGAQIKGLWLNITGGCGAGPCNPDPPKTYYDLDKPYPYLLSGSAVPDGLGDCGTDYPSTIPPHGTFTVELLVTTEKCDCRWDTRLSWVNGTSKHTLTVNDAGKPFEITSVKGNPAIMWEYSGTGKDGWVSSQYTP